MSKRECNDCSACCFTHSVTKRKRMGSIEQITDMFSWCQFVEKCGGCAIYERRPPACEGNDCLWLQGVIEESMKPTEVGFVIDSLSVEYGGVELVMFRFVEYVAGALRTSDGMAYVHDFISRPPFGHGRFFITIDYYDVDGSREREVLFANSEIFTPTVREVLLNSVKKNK